MRSHDSTTLRSSRHNHGIENIAARARHILMPSVRIMKKIISILLLLTLSAFANPRTHYQIPGVVAKSWKPTTNQVQQALSSVQQHCKVRMSDFVRTEGIDPDEIEIEIVVTGETRSTSRTTSNSYTNDIPKDFKVYGVRYSEFIKRPCPFVEKDGDGGIRFVAVQHLLPQDIREGVKGSRPFTVYYNVENGKTGLSTYPTWDATEEDEFDRVRAIYSPGPPYYIGTERF